MQGPTIQGGTEFHKLEGEDFLVGVGGPPQILLGGLLAMDLGLATIKETETGQDELRKGQELVLEGNREIIVPYVGNRITRQWTAVLTW